MQAQFSHLQIARIPVSEYPAGMELILRIRDIRHERGMTIAELAEIVGVSVPHMSGVERGVKNLNNHLLVRISEALKVEPDDLIASDDRQQLSRLVRSTKRLSPEHLEKVKEFAAALLKIQQETPPS